MSCECEDCGKVSIISNITLCEDCYRKEIEASKKQGALEELKKTIKELEDSLEFYECDYCKFEQHVVDKIMEELTEHINKLNKRLKELKEVG